MEKLEMNCLFVVKSFLDKLNFWQKEKQSIWSEYLHIEKAKRFCAYFIFPSRLHIMIQSVPVPTGPALIYNNLYNWITRIFLWNSSVQLTRTTTKLSFTGYIAGSSGWFYQALSQLSAFLHFNYQSKFLFCLFLHFYQPNLLLYIFYV